MRSAWMRREVGVADPVLQVRDLSIAWRGADGRANRVVDGVSFDLAAGGTLGIAGESGSGKSTLARALLGHCRAGSAITGGSIRLDGDDLAALSEPGLARRRGRVMAMVPQNPLASLTFHLRVGRQLEEVLRWRAGLSADAARLRAIELFGQMGLPDPERLARRYPHQLSGGQRQRVVLACAIACDPLLLVLDEPTTALDKTTEAQVLDLIRRLRTARQGAMVIVTHDLNVVADICDRVLVMQHGRIVEQGPVGQVFATPREAYTRVLLGAALRVENASRARPAAPGLPLLEVTGLGFRYARPSLLRRAPPGPPILDDIGLTLARGEVLGVIGESGSGKTTLGGIVTGLLAADRGRLAFDGTELTARRTREQRRRIQMVFQDPLSSLNPRRRVGDAVMRPLRLFHGLDQRDAARRAARLFEELGLEPALLARFPRQLSGGQQQRVAIARAFAAEPDLLICDEITSALDASVQAQVLDHLAAMQRRQGTAMLLITHDLSVVWRMARRVAVMQGGRILETGETEAIFRKPANPYTAALLGAATRAARAGQPELVDATG
ncbi:ABC transporter ATP-binding protein [Roseomonas sp. CECT 9278]|uniref:dipeptide ABC transporter ATP-binding protein n=1 Tax=Roseomonas sp. CECT 9278 TaxID=2845823 RepID=UPI001E40E908|nr:ABC transporter ATP-binding protein [Roseomonas sp. CECT 9278]CAH0200883.1 Glutathione import ATP-binding protein GsiA [Roseomonas sp. CECT 9278]